MGDSGNQKGRVDKGYGVSGFVGEVNMWLGLSAPGHVVCVVVFYFGDKINVSL